MRFFNNCVQIFVMIGCLTFPVNIIVCMQIYKFIRILHFLNVAYVIIKV